MPNNASAAKRLRQSEVRRVANKMRKTELKTLNKKLLRAIHDKEADSAEQLFRRYVKRIDQAVSRNVMHKNTASRRKAQMAKHMHELTAAWAARFEVRVWLLAGGCAHLGATQVVSSLRRRRSMWRSPQEPAHR